jgi:hypothetical protein
MSFVVFCLVLTMELISHYITSLTNAAIDFVVSNVSPHVIAFHPHIRTPNPKPKVKSKGVPLHAMEAHGGRGGIAPTHTQPWHYMGVSGQRHAPAALYPRGKDPRYPLDRRLGGPQSRSGRRG